MSDKTVAPMWKTLGITMTISMVVVLVFGMIAGIVAIDQSHELDLSKSATVKSVNAQMKDNAIWRANKIVAQKQAEQVDEKKRYKTDDKPEDGVNNKAQVDHNVKQIKAAIECFDDDSSIAYRTTRCDKKKAIADRKFALANTKATKAYKAMDEKAKARHTQLADLNLKKAEAELEYLETL